MKRWSTRRTLSLALAAAITLSNGVSALALEPSEEGTPSAAAAPAAPNVLATPYDIYPKPQQMIMGADSINLTKVINVVTENNEISQNTLDRAKRIFEGYTLEVTNTPSKDNINLYLDVYAKGDADLKHGISQEATNLLKKGESEGAVGNSEYGVYDNHVIHVDDNDIVVYGVHDKAVYYGLATIEQMLEQSPDGLLMKVDINDYANAKWRGVIEGFYGIAYSREDIINFMKWGEKFKMNTFMYGPKGDPYHLSKWKDHYPTSLTDAEVKKGMLTEQDIREITSAGNQYGVNFTWTIHPMMLHGIDLTTGTTDGSGWVDDDTHWTGTPNDTKLTNMQDGLNAIIDKFSYMYDLGVRQFGLFVDDINEGMAERCSVQQRRLLEEVQFALQGIPGRYNGSTNINKFSDINKNTFYVPTRYAIGGLGDKDQNLKELKKLDTRIKDNVVIMYTGSGVWSSLSNQDNLKMANEIGRKPMLWWNEPCNDDGFMYTYLGPIEQTKPPVDNKLYDLTGVMANPMSEAEASKVAVGSVLGLDWNMSAFDDPDYSHIAWERSVRSLFPEEDKDLADAFFLFAKHSEPRPMDNDYTGIKKHADALLKDLSVNGCLTADSQNARQAMAAEMERLIDACDLLSKRMPNHEWSSVRNMYSDELKPWILKSKAMAELALDSIELLQTNESNLDKYQNSHDTFYRVLKGHSGLSTNDDFVIYPQRGAGDETYEMGRTLVSVGGGTFNTLIHTMRDVAETYYNDTLAPLSAPKATITANVDNAKLTLADNKGVVSLTANENITLKTGDYIGMSLNTLRANKLTSTMPQGLTAQYSTNGKTWTTMTNPNMLIDEQASAVRFINITTGDIVIPASGSITLTPSSMPTVVVNDGSLAEITTSPHQYYEKNYPQNTVDGKMDTMFWWSTSPSNGNNITIKLPQQVNVQQINLYMGDEKKGDSLEAAATVQLSQDGGTWYDIAYLNKGSVGNHELATTGTNGEQITVDSAVQNIVVPNTSTQITQAQYIRLEFTGPQANWLKVREIFVNDIKDLKPIDPTSSLPLANNSSLDNLLDNRLDTYLETKNGTISGTALNYEFTDATIADNVQLVFGGSEGMLKGKATVSVSADNGANYIELGTLNETISPEVVNKHQFFTIDSETLQSKNVTSVTNLRVEFTENQDAPLHAYRVALNGASQANWAHAVDQDGNFVSQLDDRNNATAFTPSAGGWVQVTLPSADKLETVNVFAVADTDPSFEVLTNGAWSEVSATKEGETKFALDVSDLMNVTDLRISYDNSSLPYGIYEVTTTSTNYVEADKSALYQKIAELEAALAAAKDANVISALKDALASAYGAANGEATPAQLSQQVQNANEALAVKPNNGGGGIIHGGNGGSSGSSSVSYVDVPYDAWFYDAVDFVNKSNLMIGTDASHFSPSKATTRGMVVTVLWRYAGKPALGKNTFSDITSDAYYTDAVAWAADQGIVSGYPNGKFGPNDKMTREQFAAILYRYAKSPAVTGNLDKFADKGRVSSYAKNAMTWAVESGIMSGVGDNKLAPQNTATRAHVAQMLKNFVERGY